MLVWADRVAELTTTTGTGALTLAGALTSYVTFASVCAVDDQAYYLILAIDGSGNPTGDWEVGLGTYSAANTLTRSRVLASSNAGAAVNFSAGTKRVVLTSAAAAIAAAGMAPPLLADFPTALNNSFMTAADTADGLSIVVTTGGAGTVLRGYLKTLPASPLNVIFKLLVGADGTASDGAGFVIRDSSGGRMIKFGIQYNAASDLVVERWTSDTNFSVASVTVVSPLPSVWLRFEDDGTNFKFYMGMSREGPWVTLLSESRTAWIAAPNQIGFAIEDQNINNYMLLIQHYEEA